MQQKILRLMPAERQKRIELLDFEINNDDLFVNIYREDYSPDISGYFMRSKTGAAVIINKNLPASRQAAVIKTIIKGMHKCPSSELGFVNEEAEFHCGGHCCFRG